ncbi:MAG: low molecular weight protein tyrosine phosphatase family protein [Gemmatimonadales bacterium]
MRVLFVCNHNRLRSPTAERVFAEEPDLDVRSAGVAYGATVPVTRELVEWADLIFVMEKRQRNILHERFPDLYRSKRIVCLYIPDIYDFMEPALVAILRNTVPKHLNRS